MIRIRNANCFGPSPMGVRDVLVGGGEVLAIEPPGTATDGCASIDAEGRLLVPGLVDVLTHPCGGGGEGGFANRTGEIEIERFVDAGITTPVGALGTDSLGRSLDVLYGTIMALRGRGLEAFMYTGAYRCPVPTLTGDVARDLYLVGPCIGVGEVAIADHRGTQPSAEELRRLGSETQLGGILAGRGGTVLIHVGDGGNRLKLLRDALADSDLHPRVFFPTHVNRSMALLNEARDWTLEGGFVDITVSTTPELIAAGDVPALEALDYLLSAGAPAEQITLSSDAGGSLPLYEAGHLKGLTAARPDVMPALLHEARTRDPEIFQVALAAMTANPARALGLGAVGGLAEGTSADLVLIEPDAGGVEAVMCRGKWLMRDRELMVSGSPG